MSRNPLCPCRPPSSGSLPARNWCSVTPVPATPSLSPICILICWNASPTAAELLYHVDRIQHDGVSRADVLAGFSESPEYLVRMVGTAGFNPAEI
jgi:hypothetical protein